MQGRSEGGPGVPVTPPFASLFLSKQPTIFRGENVMTIMFDTVRPPFEKSWLRPWNGSAKRDKSAKCDRWDDPNNRASRSHSTSPLPPLCTPATQANLAFAWSQLACERRQISGRCFTPLKNTQCGTFWWHETTAGNPSQYSAFAIWHSENYPCHKSQPFSPSSGGTTSRVSPSSPTTCNPVTSCAMLSTPTLTAQYCGLIFRSLGEQGSING